MLARSFDLVALQQLQDSEGRGRQISRLVKHHTAHIGGVETVHIFFRTDGHGHALHRDMLRKGQLHNKTVHFLILVKAPDGAQELCFRDSGFKAKQG